MNNPENAHANHHDWERDVSDEFHTALNDIRTEPAQPESVERFLIAATNIEHHPASLPQQPTVLPRTKAAKSAVPRVRLLASAAATLLAVAAVSFFLSSQRTAWGQVVQAVAEKPWMRLTLQKPAGKLPAGETFEEVTMWFSGDRKLAAVKSNSHVAWVNIADGDEYEFRPNSAQIRVKKLHARDSVEIRRLLTVLAPFDADLKQAAGEPLALKQTSKSEAMIDGKAYVDFVFEHRVSKAAKTDDILSVRVEKSTRQPVQMTMRKAVFAIDYPDSGPADIYALGVNKDLPVEDLRKMGKYFKDRPAPVHNDYEAVEITVIAGMEGRWINEARRCRFVDGKAKCEYADPEQVLKLADSVYFAGGDRPTGKTHKMAWWVKEVSKLDFEAADMAGNNFPHNRCYSPFGGEESYNSVHVSQLKGLEDMIELRGPQHSVWLDPKRDLIVRRFEHVQDDGTISVRQYDEVTQDSKGVWFVTEWRNGQIPQRGGLLPEKLDRRSKDVATTVHYAEIKFK